MDKGQSRPKRSSSPLATLFGIVFAIVILIVLAILVPSILHNLKIIDLSHIIDMLIEKNMWFDWFEMIIVPRDPEDDPKDGGGGGGGGGGAMSVITADATPTPTPTPM